MDPWGGHIPEASFGYVDGAFEIERQINEIGLDIEAVFLPCGTGTSQAGLIYGFGDDVDVYGVSVARSVARCVEEISNQLCEISRLDNYRKCVDGLTINVLHDVRYIYGEVSDEMKLISTTVSRTDGIFLDPIYNAKAFCGMVNYLKDKKFKDVLYINTGGQPNIFLKGGQQM